MRSVYRLLAVAALFALFLFAQAALADNPGSAFGVSDAVYAKAVLLVYGLNTALTALRNILAKYDGIDPGGQIPAGAPANLTFLNKLCIVVGKAMDFFMANPQH